MIVRFEDVTLPACLHQANLSQLIRFLSKCPFGYEKKLYPIPGLINGNQRIGFSIEMVMIKFKGGFGENRVAESGYFSDQSFLKIKRIPPIDCKNINVPRRSQF